MGIVGNKDMRTVGGVDSTNLKPGANSLANDSDVALTTLTTGQVLTWDGTKWTNDNASSGSLAALSDVSISSPTNGQALVYNTAASKWENTTLTPASIATLSDVTLSSLASGQFLKWNGTAWVNVTIPTYPTTLAGDTDVLISSPTNGQVLTYNSSAGKWENATPSGGSGITSIAGETGPVITLSSSDSSVTITPSGSNIDLKATGGGGGGGSPTYIDYPIDVPPVSPSTYDDEFTGATLASKWSIINATSGDTLRSAAPDNTGSGPGYLLIDSPYTTLDRLYGIFQTAPSVPFTMTAKLQIDGATGNYNGCLIWVLGTNGKFFGFGTIAGAGGGNSLMNVDRMYLNSDYSYNSDAVFGAAPTFAAPLYVRMVNDGTYLNCYLSASGYFGGSASASLVYQEPLSNWIAGPASIGVGLHPYGQKTRALCGWFRVTTP